jgi:hypothetical protein
MAIRKILEIVRMSGCHVFPCKVYMIRIFTILSDMSDGLITVFKGSNSTFIMLHMYIRWMLATLLINEILICWSMRYLYQKLFDYTCMLRIGYKPMILITLNTAKTCLNMIKVSCCRLMSHLPL